MGLLGGRGKGRLQAALRTATPGARNRTASATQPANREVLSHATATSASFPAQSQGKHFQLHRGKPHAQCCKLDELSYIAAARQPASRELLSHATATRTPFAAQSQGNLKFCAALLLMNNQQEGNSCHTALAPAHSCLHTAKHALCPRSVVAQSLTMLLIYKFQLLL